MSDCKGKDCTDCVWNMGAVKHFCHKRGGDAYFEESGEVAFKPKDFVPYALENGPIYYVEDDKHFDRGEFNNGRRCIHIQSRRHEKEIMNRMGCNFGEKGQEVLGHKLGYDTPEGKVHIRR